MTFDPETIAAFVDGELDDLTAHRITREAETNAALAAEIARHRALRDRLAAHYAPVAEEPVPDRLTALLAGASEQSGDRIVDSLAERRAAREAKGRSRHWLMGQWSGAQWGAMAASLALGLTIGLRPWAPAAPVAMADGMVVAAGPLAQALDTQLASNQTGDAAVRIGMSFRDRQGRYCRSFESDALDGIGCHSANGWALERTQAGTASSEFRQASSSGLAQAAAAMMVGAPLDGAAERAARDAGWGATR
ncbi:anti-sigma factor family protein [Sphingopyxis sp. MWB1]|uniref:anti-sigma factor family protein n=1 Tax=Sphingopyxis sp. MWB1 TaxID=1537715 RepID=UPI00051A898B|nr:hypothetical protein [Sphingopyxis sp. MWB1]